jgi:hypothetical protein
VKERRLAGADPLEQRAPRRQGAPRPLGVDGVGSVPAPDDAGFIARAGAGVGWTICVYERNVCAGPLEVMRCPRAERASADDEDVHAASL